MITKTEVARGTLGDKKGWNFAVYWDKRKYPNLISALYKTKKETQAQLKRYLETGEFDTYGSAE